MRTVLLLACITTTLFFYSVNAVTAVGNVGVDITITGSCTNTTAASAIACASLCDLASSCVAWSWNSCGSNRCSLLTSVGPYIMSASCSTSNAKLGQVGVDRQGTAISGFSPYNLNSGSTAANCAQLCFNTTGCVMWSFDNVGRQGCYLSSSITATKTANAARTSGIQGTSNLNTPYFGLNTIILPANSSATQCAELCFATPGCKVWLYQPPSAACGNTFAAFCWAKTMLFYSGNTDSCYVTGQQPISTATAPADTSVTPAQIVAAAPAATFPFNKIVAFGDNLSDNGNGSYAHCVAAPGQCTNSIYGARTWTDGPIAVSFLSTYLNAPLAVDYAYGHANGGSKFGATIDNTYTQSQANAPSAKDQIANYTATGRQQDIGTTLHFLWIGANDINLYHIDPNSANNSKFATQFSALMVQRVQELINAGATYIFVSNLYPKHIAPSSVYYTGNPTQVANLGAAISQANAAVKSALVQFGANVIYHDVFSFMMKLWNNHDQYGISHVYNNEYCDGYSQINWELCVTDNLGRRFFWMQTLDMTSPTHNLIAADMYNTLATRFKQ